MVIRIGWLNEWLDIAGFSIRASGWRNLLTISRELTTYVSLEITPVYRVFMFCH